MGTVHAAEPPPALPPTPSLCPAVAGWGQQAAALALSAQCQSVCLSVVLCPDGKISGMCKREGPGQDCPAQPSSRNWVSPNFSEGEGSASASLGSPAREEDAPRAGREGEAPAEHFGMDFGVQKCPTECVSFTCLWAETATCRAGPH